MELVSFDGGVRERVRVVRPDRYRAICLGAEAGPRICRGGGFSYAPASFGKATLTIDHSRFDRILDFDARTGEIECEGGTTLGTLHAFLEPRGFFLPVQPGYPGITIGGCASSDAHGKNQFRDGTFRAHVLSLRLFHPRHGEIEASPTTNAEAFELTLGGLGLTGSILTIRLRAARLPASTIEMVRRPLPAFDAVLDALQETAEAADFLYTWHDMTRTGPSFGRGFLVEGRFRETRSEPRKTVREPRWSRMTPQTRGATLPPLLNRATTAPFNRTWAALQRPGNRCVTVPLFDFLFPVARRTAYFKLFGRRGFHEMQWIVPKGAVPNLQKELPRLLRRWSAPTTLASCKLFRGEPSLVRFDGPGLCLALDFPRDSRSAALAEDLDRLGCDLGVVPNIGKDSRLSEAVAGRGLPGFQEFHERLRRWDPDRLYRSALSERMDL